MDSELLGKVIWRIKAVAGIEAFLVFPVTALHLAVVAGRIGADQLVADAKLLSGFFEKGRHIPPAVVKSVGELKPIVRLDAFHPDTSEGVPFKQPFQKVGGRKGGLLRTGSQETQTCELVNSSVLIQAELWVCNTTAWHNFHIHLNSLARIGHLLVRLWFVALFLLGLREQSQLAHAPEQTLRAAGIAPQPVPQFYHAEIGVAAAHIPDQLQFRLCVLIGMAVRASELTGQRGCCSIPAGLPEIDVRPALVVLPAGAAHAIFLRVFHQELPICHVLCYTLTHEGYGPLSFSCYLQLQLYHDETLSFILFY